MPRTKAPKAPKPPKLPTWRLWRHKVTKVIYNHPDYYTKGPFNWNTRSHEPGGSIDDLEELNPNEFELVTTLHYEGYYKGRSAVGFRFHDMKHNDNHIMLISDFDEMVKKTTISEGVVCGRWKFVKKGSSIGIKLIEELQSDEETIQLTPPQGD